MLDFCLALPADAVVVECAGDPVSANAPALLSCLKARRSELKITLAAADALGRTLLLVRLMADAGVPFHEARARCLALLKTDS